MRLLLDTHVFLWLALEPERITASTLTLLEDPSANLYLSAVVAWEIAIKQAVGKLPVPPGLRTWIPQQVEAMQLTPLPVTIAHALGVAALPRHHADPFDRLLVAQAIAEGLSLVTADQRLERYPVQVIRC